MSGEHIPTGGRIFKPVLRASKRSRLLAEIARIDDTIADIEAYYALDEPILFGWVEVARADQTIAMLRCVRRQLQRQAAP